MIFFFLVSLIFLLLQSLLILLYVIWMEYLYGDLHKPHVAKDTLSPKSGGVFAESKVRFHLKFAHLEEKAAL